MLARSRNPLEPMATVVWVLLALTGIGMVASVVATVLGSGSIMGFGESVVYIDVPVVASADLPLGPYDLRGDVSPNTIGYRFFVAHADVGQRIWYTLIMLPGILLFVGVLLLAYRLIRAAERDGIYTSATARRLRTLGWFLLAGALVKMVMEMVAANRLLATMVTNEVGWFGPIRWQIPWTLLLIATGLLTFTRIMWTGAGMRDELQGTV